MLESPANSRDITRKGSVEPRCRVHIVMGGEVKHKPPLTQFTHSPAISATLNRHLLNAHSLSLRSFMLCYTSMYGNVHSPRFVRVVAAQSHYPQLPFGRANSLAGRVAPSCPRGAYKIPPSTVVLYGCQVRLKTPRALFSSDAVKQNGIFCIIRYIGDLVPF